MFFCANSNSLSNAFLDLFPFSSFIAARHYFIARLQKKATIGLSVACKTKMTSKDRSKRKCIFHNLPIHLTDICLRGFLEQAGRIESLAHRKDWKNPHKNMTTVIYRNKKSVRHAVSLIQNIRIYESHRMHFVIFNTELRGWIYTKQGNEIQLVPKDRRTLYVGNIDKSVSEEFLWLVFLEVGPVKYIKVPRDRQGNSRSFAYVEFHNAYFVSHAARHLDGTSIYGRRIRLRRKHPIWEELSLRLG